MIRITNNIYVSKAVKKRSNDHCEGCGYKPQGDLYYNKIIDLYLCEGCDEVAKQGTCND